MELKEILNENPLTLKGLQKLQEEYDRRFVSQKGFTGFKKLRHTYAHLGKLLGRLADYVHNVEENGMASNENVGDVITKVIPDLLVYACWLAGEFDLNLEQTYLTRFLNNLDRLYSDKISATEFHELEDSVNSRFKNLI